MKKILIIGDTTMDHLYHSAPKHNEGQNWELYPTLHTTLIPGGAFILTDFVKKIIKEKNLDAEVIGQTVPEDFYGKEARSMIQAKILLAKHKEKDSDYIRVDKYYGYSAPLGDTNVLPLLEGNADNVNLLILDDAGNGFRDQKGTFPSCIESENTLLVYKMSRPLAKGKLWEKVCSRKKDWVVIIQAKDIRLCNNVNVSKALSWERTAMEMVFQLKRNASLYELQKAPYLVILFGSDGALLISQNHEEKPLLIFDPMCLEGGYASTLNGHGLSLGSVFTASMSVSILQHGLGGIVNGIKSGLSAMRNLHKSGFIEKNKKVSYPHDLIFKGEAHLFSECLVGTSYNLNDPDPDFWRILDEKTKLSKPLVTIDIVINESPKILQEIPVGKYGKMQTFDRSEIEQFNSIKKLILEYLDDTKPGRPLCIAVFGPPGSGKSFGIKQMLNSLGREDIPTMTFNISQYASYNDLISDFHKVRDMVLTGATPVAFFDEFDSDKDPRSLGWLKYFLSPMQDGKFKEGEAIHPIGKSIFVFAGGTRSSFQDFEQNISTDPIKSKQFSEEERRKEQIKRLEEFREAKGPDFVSRLRGFINILGPNPNHHIGMTDNNFMIRRAKVLRTNFVDTAKTKHLINSEGVLQIDTSVLRAMLNIPEYKHGNRSMSSILDMSRLTDKTKFDLSALPTPEQLDMHVNAKLFMWLAGNERFYSLLPVEERFDLIEDSPMLWEQQLIDKIAEKMHEDYYRQRTDQGQETYSVIVWAELPENKKKSNLDAAADIPVKLSLIGFGIRKIKENELMQSLDKLNEDNIEMLAEEEHERWCREQMLQGWRYGEIRDDQKKLHPSLVPWNRLEESEKKKDREAVSAIPRIVNEVGFIIHKFEDYTTKY